MNQRYQEGDLHDTEARAWRDGNWIICMLAGKVVSRRYTRAKVKTARFRFRSHQSPRVSRSKENFTRVEFTNKPPNNNPWSCYDNWIETEIEPKPPVPCANLPF